MKMLLAISCDAKTIKGEKRGYLTGILYLAPAAESGAMNCCPKATPGCMRDCLYTAGRGVFAKVRRARVRKTRYLVRDREGFLNDLRASIRLLVTRAKHKRMTPAVRINGTSDLPQLALQMAREFPTVQFYDYTKIPRPWERTLANYHLSFSRSELNERDCFDALHHGINVVVVFDTRKGEPLPAKWWGYRVVDGDRDDLRFLDPRGVVVGVRAKGRARQDKGPGSSGFVALSKLMGAGEGTVTRGEERRTA